MALDYRPLAIQRDDMFGPTGPGRCAILSLDKCPNLWYIIVMKEKENRDEITFHGFVSEDDETYYGCDTITAPDGKEYPIRDRD